MRPFIFFLILLSATFAEETLKAPEANPIVEFVSGFLDGIHEVKTIEDLIKCMKNADEILQKIKDGISIIIKGLKKINLETILKGFNMLFEAFFDLEKMIRPCLVGFTQFEKLLKAFKNIELLKLIFKILANPGPIIEDLIDIIESFADGDYHQAGTDLGDVLYRLFLTETYLETSNPVFDFVSGFLKGIKEEKGIQDLIKCLKNADQILEKIKKALEVIMKMKSLEELLAGLKLLFAAFLELEEMVKPCLEGFHQFKRLLKEIRHADLNKIMAKLIKSWPFFLSEIIDIVVCFANGKFECAGHGLGEILNRLFLEGRLLESNGGNPIFDFLNGFLQGIHEPKQVEDLMKCMKNADQILQKIMDAVQLIVAGLKKVNLDTILKGFNMLFSAIYDLEKALLPCLKEYTQFIKLLEAIKSCNLVKIIFRILSNPNPYIEDFMDMIDCFEEGDFLQAGSDLGDILYRLFMAGFREEANPIYEFVSGFLLGIKETKTIDDLLKCLKNADQILEKIKQALETIRTMKNVDDLLRGLKMLFAAFVELEELLKPCLEGFTQFKRILKEIRHVDFNKLLQKIISRWPYFLDDIIECILAFTKAQYSKAGKCLGDMLYRLFLQDSYDSVSKHYPGIEFLRGLLKGIKEKKTIEDIAECLKGSIAILCEIKKLIKEIIRSIKKVEIVKVIEDVKKIIALLKELHKEGIHCLCELEQVIKLIHAVYLAKFMELVHKVLKNPQAYIADLVALYKTIWKKDYQGAGLAVGDIIFRLFLE